MDLELSELRAFTVLARELHFRKASEQLFLSQPALTKKIQRLEEKIGGPLLVRSRRRVSLTEAGRVLLPTAAELLRDAESAVAETKAAVEGRAGTLRIGFGIASVSEILPRTILRFRQLYPQVELQMRDMSSPSQLAALLDGRLDVGLLRMPVANSELSSVPLFREHLVLAAPFALSHSLKRGLSAFRNRPFIFLPRSVSETFHDHAIDLCQRAGFRPQIVQEASEMFTVLNLVRAGLGVSLVPSSAVRLRVPAVRFRDLHMKEALWTIGIAWNRSSEKQSLISHFVAAVRGIVRAQSKNV
jgi:DNA-binding transcriptional LysR family regulator